MSVLLWSLAIVGAIFLGLLAVAVVFELVWPGQLEALRRHEDAEGHRRL